MNGDGEKKYGGRPKGLKGRDIGMYYRKLAQRRAKDDKPKERERIKLGPNISVPPELLVRVKDCLFNFALNNENEKVTYEFEQHFHRLLSLNFEEFIAEAKSDKSQELQNKDNLNQRFKTDMLAKEITPEFRERFDKRQKLPAMQQSERILQAIQQNQVVLIVGSTGCGKTTQVPQMLLDEYIYNDRGSQCHIICTQPRRISAVTVAERVAYERHENLGNSVGYQIRLESKMPREQGSILYCTSGVLLQKMRSNPLMYGVNVLLLDEIHERSVETDLLMALLKNIIPHRPDFKVVLMSATVCEEEIRTYFNNCNTMHIEGTLFPVKVHYLEDILQEVNYTKFLKPVNGNAKFSGHHKPQKRNKESDFLYGNMIESYIKQIRNNYSAQVLQALRCTDSEGCENLAFIEHLIFYICEHKPPGAILVFLPGYNKISQLHALLQKPRAATSQRFAQKIQVYALHSLMPTVNQLDVFLPPPDGMRKVILSTIIAETSVTIDDVVYVINTGRTKIKNYNHETNVQSLDEAWVTKANTKQRKGRAGRVQPGVCYNLFTRIRESTMQEMPTPEILRSKLESIILSLKLLHFPDVSAFMADMLDAPNEVAIKNGIDLLKRMEALDKMGRITPLGMHLARLPIDPQVGKMILMAALFRCIDPITTVAAGLSYKSPFYTPLGLGDKVDAIKRNLSANKKSDHLLLDVVVQNYRDAITDHTVRDFCYKNFLNLTTLQQLENMKQQFANLLQVTSFIDTSNCRDKSINVNSNNLPLLRAIIASGLYPNMAHLRKARQRKNHVRAIHHMSTPENGRINFHPSSVNAGASSFDSNYFVYFQKQKSSALYMLDATMVYPMALLIFGDEIEHGRTPHGEDYISIGHHYFFKCDQNTRNVILQLRERLNFLLQKKALNPSPIAPNSNEQSLITAIQLLLSLDEVEDNDDDYLSSDNDQ